MIPKLKVNTSADMNRKIWSSFQDEHVCDGEKQKEVTVSDINYKITNGPFFAPCVCVC